MKIKKEIDCWLRTSVYPIIGMDAPHNHKKIVSFIKNDVRETADPKEYHDGDFGIAFRRWIEAQSDKQP